MDRSHPEGFRGRGQIHGRMAADVPASMPLTPASTGGTDRNEPLPRNPETVILVPDHTLLRIVGSGAYGEVWLARSAFGTPRAVKVIRLGDFPDPRPFDREFRGIQRYEPVSRGHDGLIDILQVGRNEPAGYFYYVMELADAVPDEEGGARAARSSPAGAGPGDAGSSRSTTPIPTSARPPEFPEASYAPRTLRHEIKSRGRLPLAECLRLGATLADPNVDAVVIATPDHGFVPGTAVGAVGCRPGGDRLKPGEPEPFRPRDPGRR
jgi:hypothetical protein